jgi:AcrR family transcriptional regulator
VEVASDESRPSLRERKKERTHRALVETAQHLFRTQGYAQTTLEQICEEAEVSVGTLQRYFDSKERLALYPYYQAVERLREMLRSPDREEDVLTTWRSWIQSEAEHYPTLDPTHWDFVDAAPELLARRLAILQQAEELLATALSEEAGVDAETDLYAHVLAAALDAGVATAFRHWRARDQKQNLVKVMLEVVDFVLQRFGPRDHGAVVPRLRSAAAAVSSPKSRRSSAPAGGKTR